MKLIPAISYNEFLVFLVRFFFGGGKLRRRLVGALMLPVLSVAACSCLDPR
jgi:hypothetical protein